MAPKKPSKAGGKKGKKTEPEKDELAFDPVKYETKEIVTSIEMLSSTEYDLMKQALLTLGRCAHKNDTFLQYLYTKNVLPKVMELIYQPELVVLRVAMKMVAQLLVLPDALNAFHAHEWQLYLKQLICIFLENEDQIVKEFVTFILMKITRGNPALANSLVAPEIIVRIFKSLKEQTDADVQSNLLDLLYNSLDAPNIREMLSSNFEFKPRILLCYVKCEVPQLSGKATDIILKLAYWRHEATQNILLKENILQDIVGVVMNTNEKEQQVRLLNVLNVFMESEEVATQYTETLQFLEFCQFMPTCPKAAMLPVSAFIKKLTKFPSLMQRLVDLSVEDALLSLLRINNEAVICNVCEALQKFMQHKFCCKKIASPAVLKSILDICANPEVAMTPYKEMCFKTLYEFIKKSSTAMQTIVDLKGIHTFTTVFENEVDNMTNTGYNDVLDIIHIFSLKEQYQLQIMNRELYRMVLNLLPVKTGQALSILNQYITNAEYRNLFIELKGAEVVIARVRDIHSEDMFKYMLIFIQNSLVYKQLAMHYLKSGLLQLLQCIKKIMRWELPMVDALLESVYDIHLPLKFHERNRLEITDVIRDKFYLVRETWGDQFPFIEILESKYVSTTCTIYLVDFEKHGSDNVDELNNTSPTINYSDIIKVSTESIDNVESSLFSRLKSKQYMSTSALYKKRILAEDNRNRDADDDEESENRKEIQGILKTMPEQSNNTETIGTTTEQEKVTRVSFSEPNDVKSTAKLVPSYVNFEFAADENNLSLYVQDVKRELFSNKKTILCFEHQVKMLARYVHSVLTLEDYWDVKNKHLFLMQLQILKKQLESSIIPIQYLKFGQHCEKALLFKILCDRLELPATLVKGPNLIYWNEVPIMNTVPLDTPERENHMAYYIVDLMKNVGDLMIVGSKEANLYCKYS